MSSGGLELGIAWSSRQTGGGESYKTSTAVLTEQPVLEIGLLCTSELHKEKCALTENN